MNTWLHHYYPQQRQKPQEDETLTFSRQINSDLLTSEPEVS